MSAAHHVVIIGGGASGLAAALRLQEFAAEGGSPIRISLVEKHGRLGGCVETRRSDGFLMEMGAESIPVEKPWAIALIDRLGLRDSLLEPRAVTKGTLILSGRHLRKLPEDFALFTPRSILSLASSRLFSPAGIARAAMEPFVPRRTALDDESLASFVSRRFGREVLDRLAQPLFAGLYSADPARLSMQAVLPRIHALERERGSLVRAMRDIPVSSGTRLVTLRNGLGSLADAIAQRINPHAIIHDEVRALRPLPAEHGATWLVRLTGDTVLQADAIICAAPAWSAAEILAGAHRDLPSLLRSIRYNSLAVVTLAYRETELRAIPHAHGMLVPYREGRHVTALTFSSLKYAYRAPAGHFLLRAYVGGGLQGELLSRNDGEIVTMVREDLRAALGIDVPPRSSVVRRWIDALPEYGVGHLERVAEIERHVQSLANFAITGAAYRGVGVSDCVRSGERAAERIATLLLKSAHVGT